MNVNIPARSHLRSVPLSEPTEEELVRAAQAGDRRAFSELFRKHARYVAGVAYRVMGAGNEVDDVVQETFIAVHRGIKNLTEPAAFRRWAVTIAIRNVHRRLRARNKSRQLDEELFLQLEASTDADLARQIEDLYEALEGIDPDLRIAWLLARMEGYTLPDVAEHCCVSLATAKRRIALAEKRLRRRMDHG